MNLALKSYLKPLEPFLLSDKVSEVCINRPREVWLEEDAHFRLVSVPELTEARLRLLADLVAEANHKDLSETKPLLSATLPGGARCQFVLPPACDRGQFVCSIRKASIRDLSLQEWEERGSFAYATKAPLLRSNETQEKLQALLKAGHWKELLVLAVKSKQNIIISGGTSTAKTSLLNSLLKEIAPQERLVTIEGVREVKTSLCNTVHLLANEDEESPLSANMLDLLKASFRLRPDRIFLSELRSREAYPYLRACLSGHPGSMTTLHAGSIESAKEQLCFMLSEAPELTHATEARLRRLISLSVQVFVQMERLNNGDRIIEDIQLEGPG